MNVKQLNVACFSDIHLGHKRNHTRDIIRNLNIAFPDNAVTGELDIIFLSGDLFDRLLVLPDPNVTLIKNWITRFLRLCKKHDIVLRVLEGTPSHDWKQSGLFMTLNEISGIDCDVKYFDILALEYIERFAISVIYIPDEWRTDTEDTYFEVMQTLNSHSLKKVDFIIMHGCFDYQLPKHVKVPMHNSDRYNELVKYAVFNGHVHTHTTKGNIIVPGSFDRLSHNEEEDKGHIRLTVKSNGDKEIVFVPNCTAKVYKTIECLDDDVGKTLSLIETSIKGLPEDSYIRLSATKDNPIFNSIKTLVEQYPQFNFTVKETGAKHITDEVLSDMRKSYQPISITNNNIKQLLLDRMSYKVNAVLVAKAEALINEVI